MAAYKFKVGDKVRVKDGLECGVVYDGIWCNTSMTMTTTPLTIKEIKTDHYTVRENPYVWNDEMFETADDYEYIFSLKEAKPIFDGVRKTMDKWVGNKMLKIIDYKYNSETGETWIKWVDKTETRVRPENDTKPNQFVGFVTAYAKKAAGNTNRINNLFDKWAIKKPIQDKKAEEKRIADEIEEKRILEKRKAKREKWLIRKEALRIKREYEARKIAHEKYGVPMDDEQKKKKGDKK